MISLWLMLRLLYGASAAPPTKEPSSTTLLARHWLMHNASAPICRLVNSQCIVPTGPTIRTTLCTPNAGDLDRSFADAVAKLAASCSVFHLLAERCLSFYWATSLKFARYNATHDDLRVVNDTHGLVQFTARNVGTRVTDADPTFNTSADWIVSTDERCEIAGSADCLTLDLIATRALRGLILAPRASSAVIPGVNTTNASFAYLAPTVGRIRAHAEARGFAVDNETTQWLRSQTSVQRWRQTLVVFVRKEMVAKHADTSFLAMQNNNIAWNNGLSFAGRWIRAYTPRTVDWTRYRIVIGVLSTTKSGAMRQTIRETWAARAKAIGALVLFMIAEPIPDSVNEAERHGDMILLEAREVYTALNSTLPLKTHAIMQLVARYATSVDWIFKCDDDTIVFPERLASLLAPLGAPRTTRYYVGCSFVRTPPVRTASHPRAYVSPDLYPASVYPTFMSGGAGYALSIAAVRCLAVHTASATYRYFPREDVSVRLALDAACTPIKIVDRSDAFRANTHKPPTNATVTLHYVKGTGGIRSFWNTHLNV